MRRGTNSLETNYLHHCNGRAPCGEYLVMESLGATAAALEPSVEAGSGSPPFDDFYWKQSRARDAVTRQLEDAQ